MADLAGAQFLGFRRKADECIDLSVGKKLLWRNGRAGNPFDVPDRVKPDMGGHGRYEHMRGSTEVMHAHRLTLEIRDCADALGRKQLKTAHMHAGDDRDLFAGVDGDESGRREVQSEIDLAARDRFRLVYSSIGQHVLNVSKTLRA